MKSFAYLKRYNGHVCFYQKIFNQKGHKLSTAYLRLPPKQVQENAVAVSSVKVGHQVIFCEDKAKRYMEENYLFEQEQSWNNCQLVTIKNQKHAGE